MIEKYLEAISESTDPQVCPFFFFFFLLSFDDVLAILTPTLFFPFFFLFSTSSSSLLFLLSSLVGRQDIEAALWQQCQEGQRPPKAPRTHQEKGQSVCLARFLTWPYLFLSLLANLLHIFFL